jgi:chemosensory pili system protein ChpB (putative protein-glutamate methylesterase)
MVTDTHAAMMQIRALMEELGQPVSYALTSAQIANSTPLHPSVWLVISEDAADIFEILTEWSDAPIFLADQMPPQEDAVYYQQWKTSLCDKLSKILELAETTGVSAGVQGLGIKEPVTYEAVWVLAASLGGPESMKIFLSHINPDIPVAFVYAQHIEQDFDKVLPKVLGKASKLKLTYCTTGDKLQRGEVMVIPSHNFTTVEKRGKFQVKEGQEWDKPYTPNIDQVINNVAQVYRNKMGVIMFSGTCDDGAAASIKLKKAGVTVWAQEPEECICAAMPEAVIKAGVVDFVGTAEALAIHLNEHYISN